MTALTPVSTPCRYDNNQSAKPLLKWGFETLDHLKFIKVGVALIFAMLTVTFN
jgi:hypothetical protein